MTNAQDNSVLKIRVKLRAGYCCEYYASQEDFSPDTFSIEHIHPIAKGGTNTFENLANACQQCNNHKYTSTEAVDTLTGNLAPLYNPRTDRWSEHFAWSEDFTQIIGLTQQVEQLL